MHNDMRDQSGYRRNTPTGQAKHAYSTQQTEGKARRLAAKLTSTHAKFKGALS